jgi:hypothetical protein
LAEDAARALLGRWVCDIGTGRVFKAEAIVETADARALRGRGVDGSAAESSSAIVHLGQAEQIVFNAVFGGK